jgi:hypothetical protein
MKVNIDDLPSLPLEERSQLPPVPAIYFAVATPIANCLSLCRSVKIWYGLGVLSSILIGTAKGVTKERVWGG